MGAVVVTTADRIVCPHGGNAILTTANNRVRAGAHIVVDSDVHAIAGCPFYRGDTYSPCMTLEWKSPASRAEAAAGAAVLTTSVGRCKNAEGAVQGVAIISPAQRRATAQ